MPPQVNGRGKRDLPAPVREARRQRAWAQRQRAQSGQRRSVSESLAWRLPSCPGEERDAGSPVAAVPNGRGCAS